MFGQNWTRREALQNLGLTATAAGLSAYLNPGATEAAPRATPAGSVPSDARLGELKDLNGYFPFTPSATPEEWAKRREYVTRQMLVACGLWPMPSRPAIKATVHGRVERDDYVVDRVFFESSPGLLVTGSLYRPKGKDGPLPTILCPHGHWASGRFHDHGDGTIKQELASGGEKFEIGGRHPLQARSVQLARMGCLVFLYDMQGYADNGSFTFDLIHRFAKQRPELSSPDRWGMFSAQSELRLLNALGLQTWNSIRAVDWLCSLPEVDQSRIGVTGASGGGTQTFMLAALDERIAAAFPAVMVSTAMQGGCTCENATYLRVNTGNIEFAAMVAPRPIAMTGANDWTREIETKGLPELKQHFAMLGVPDRVAARYMNFPHNYNHPSRQMMYEFFNQHLKLGQAKIEERDYQPLTQAETTVWSGEHKGPELTEDYEVQVLKALDDDLNQKVAALTPKDAASLAEYRRVIGGALDVMIGRGLPGAGEVAYEKVTETDREGFKEYAALLRVPKHREELPSVFLLPSSWNHKVVIALGANGKSDLFDSDDKPVDSIQKLIDAGYAIASADLLYQGEFLKNGQPLAKTRSVNNPREFLGYTLGYNHPLFSQRVHDVLTLISFVKHHESKPEQISLLALDGQTGLLAAAACAQSGGAVQRLAVSTNGFRFGSITDIRDVNLLPGAVRYGDVPFLLALCAPAALWLGGEKGQVPAVTVAAYQAAGAKAQAFTGPADAERRAATEWLLS